MFEYRVLNTVLGSKRGEMAGEWGKLNNEELKDFRVQLKRDGTR